MGNQEGSGYRTSDLYYAAYLRVAGVPFLEAVRENGRVVFIFDEVESSISMRGLKAQFFNGKAQVSALDFTQAIKTMKSLTHMDSGG
jgi:hypothetical protein